MNHAAFRVFLLVLSGMTRMAMAGDTAGVEFFEQKIRPVLVESCYACHNSHDKAEGGLALDDRDGMREGGTTGPAIVPGAPGQSLLMRAIRHENGSPRMPKEGSKLPARIVADFERWIKLGAPDPRDEPPTARELGALTSWDAVRERRKQWWSFQPLARPELPTVRRAEWSDNLVDRFVLARLEQAGLEPAGPADGHTLIRRVTFALTGLPPAPGEIDRFLQDPSPDAYEVAVDRLLQSPGFGERWARHWMDSFRYADSHGSEGDPEIPYAWRYRDYLIRALNADVPYDRLVREHIAGDLISDPRINAALQINESALGVGQFRFVLHGYAPTEALEEQVIFTDNQIDVLTKSLLGLTVSCARCHNHKFDPIGQADFYALYGIMASSRPALITVDTPERLQINRDALRVKRGEIAQKLIAAWMRALDSMPGRLRSFGSRPAGAREVVANDRAHPLHAWTLLHDKQDAAFAEGWDRLSREPAAGAAPQADEPGVRWDLTGSDYAAWFKHGSGLSAMPSPPGEFHVLPKGDQVVLNVYPAGVYTHRLSNKHNGVLSSPRFKLETDTIWVRAAGGNARLRLVVQNYPRATGGIYKPIPLQSDDLKWQRIDTRYWKGEWVHIEIATSGDLPVEVTPNDGRSWFGVAEVEAHDENWKPRLSARWPAILARASDRPRAPADLARMYISVLRDALAAWAAGTMTDDQAELAGGFVRSGLLPNTLEALPGVAKLVAEYRRLEAEIPVPTRAPGVVEGTVFDQPLFDRGNSARPGAPVPRRFLEVFGSKPYATPGSGRLALADDIVNPGNPLTPRVLVNRIWHHLFGRGIVATTDNFGRLGDEPTHPELLDALAARVVADGWSIKKMIRLIVTSRTFRMDSHPSKAAAARDPANLQLSHFPVRRLEGEAIRDAILAVSGELDRTLYGPVVSGKSPRRSVYVRVQRNNLDPFLNVFDAPEPSTARGRRDTTNVPAQSLTMLNDPWVGDRARQWAEGVARDPERSTDDERIERMFAAALGRQPTTLELGQCQEFLAEQDRQGEAERREARRLDQEIASRAERIAALTAPVRKRLASKQATPRRVEVPAPVARWEFDDDLRDAEGKLHGHAIGNARIEAGALVLDGKSHVETAPLTRPLSEKTLEAWVTLASLDQRGGGVMGLETIGGQSFDAIVYGEKAAGEWLAGSNNFRRTQPFQAPRETEAVERPVHLTLVYQPDGLIVGYRNGRPYGQSYKSAGPFRFEAGQAHILFGLRHSPAGGGKLLKGRILHANLYDRALRPDEIAASGGVLQPVVSESEVFAALAAADRAECDRLAGEIAGLTTALRKLGVSNDQAADPARRWQDLAHAILNFKEFVYVR